MISLPPIRVWIVFSRSRTRLYLSTTSSKSRSSSRRRSSADLSSEGEGAAWESSCEPGASAPSHTTVSTATEARQKVGARSDIMLTLSVARLDVLQHPAESAELWRAPQLREPLGLIVRA
jgi:hypothetical protein